MREHEIRNMLSDIINNNAEYECRPTGGPLIYNKWKLYKLGEEIHSDYEYRKVTRYAVIMHNHKYEIYRKSVISDTKIYFESDLEEECKKWIDDNASWIEKNYGEPYWITDEIDANEIRISAIEDFVKEFLSRVYKDAKEYNDETLSIEDLEKIIKEMGVSIHSK